MKENAYKFIKQKNSNIARSHNLRFMARAMVAYIIKTATISHYLGKLNIKLSIFGPIRPVPLPLSPNW